MRSHTRRYQTAPPKTWYIDPAGSNSNRGNYQGPFATHNFAFTLAKPGDTIVFRGGSYTYASIASIQNWVGKPGKNIKIINSPGETPDITVTTGAGITFKFCTYITLKGLVIHPTNSHGIEVECCSYMLVANNEVSASISTGGVGIHFYARAGASDLTPCNYNIIERNLVHDMNGEGIYIKTWRIAAENGPVDGNIIQYNELYSLAHEAFQNTRQETANGLAPTRTIIRGNYCHGTFCTNAAGNGIFGIDGSDTLIENNLVESADMTAAYGICSIGGNLGTTIIRNNIFETVTVNKASSCGAFWVYSSDGYVNGIVKIYHNTVYDYQNIGASVAWGYYFTTDSPTTAYFHNNIIMNCERAIFNATQGDPDYNCVYGNGGGGSGSNPVTTDPVFVTNGSNFHLQSGSPCINAGKTGETADAPVDYDNIVRDSTPDIGAYQYV